MAITTFPASDELGRLVYEASLVPENATDDWITKVLFAAAIAHEKGFLSAADKSTDTAEASQEQSLSQRMVQAVSNETYALGRRGSLQFPTDVSGKEIVMRATVAKRASGNLQGVIMAQGGKDNGYGLFIQDGKLNMVVNQKGKSYKATSTKPLPAEFDLTALLEKNGQMTVKVDGKTFAKAKAPSGFTKPLVGNVRSGEDFDNENKIGKYEGTFQFEGNLQNISLELID